MSGSSGNGPFADGPFSTLDNPRLEFAMEIRLAFPPLKLSRDELKSLRAGDVLPVGAAPARHIVPPPNAGMPLPDRGARLRVLEGPHAVMFERSSLELLYAERFLVTPQSNRMGYRLDGPRLMHAGSSDGRGPARA